MPYEYNPFTNNLDDTGVINTADVVGPGTAVIDSSLVRWDGITGTSIKGSVATLDDSGNLVVSSIALTTDLAVGDGGSGRASATAYAVICGGTTSSGAHQSIASVGTSGQVLTSNGASALPTFQNASGGGVVVQQIRNATSALTINSTILPWDDTIPQQTEGDEILTVSITPTSASSVLVIEATCMGSIDGVERKMGMAIFRDSTSDAIAATSLNASADTSVSDYSMSGSIKTYVSATSTSPTTFKLRVGNEVGAGSSVNGYTTGRIYGGVANTSLFVTEYST